MAIHTQYVVWISSFIVNHAINTIVTTVDNTMMDANIIYGRVVRYHCQNIICATSAAVKYVHCVQILQISARNVMDVRFIGVMIVFAKHRQMIKIC